MRDLDNSEMQCLIGLSVMDLSNGVCCADVCLYSSSLMAAMDLHSCLYLAAVANYEWPVPAIAVSAVTTAHMPRASSGLTAVVSSLVRRVVATPRSRLSQNGLPLQLGGPGAQNSGAADGSATPRRGSSGLIARLSSFVGGGRRVAGAGDSILSNTSNVVSRRETTGGGGMFTPRRWQTSLQGTVVAEAVGVQESVVLRQAGPIGPLSVRD